MRWPLGMAEDNEGLDSMDLNSYSTVSLQIVSGGCPPQQSL